MLPDKWTSFYMQKLFVRLAEDQDFDKENVVWSNVSNIFYRQYYLSIEFFRWIHQSVFDV